MKYFFDPAFGVRGFESDGSQDFLITDDMRELTLEELNAHLNPPSTFPGIPTSVTMRQARLALYTEGLLESVETVIDALPDSQRTAARIEWDFSSEVFRDKPFVLMLGQALGLSPEDIDQLFISAAMIV